MKTSICRTIKFSAMILLLNVPFVAVAITSFTDVTQSAGLTWKQYAGYGSSWGDFNGDGWLDVWISNHMYKPALFLNNKDGTFINIIDEAWSGDPGVDEHGGAWADFDNDGDQDFVVSAGANSGTAMRNKAFYVNKGGRLENEAAERGVNEVYSRGRNPLWLDWNNDGLLDLYMSNFIRPNDDLSRSRLFIQNSNDGFDENMAFSANVSTWFSQIMTVLGETYFFTVGSGFPARFHKIGEDAPSQFTIDGVKKFWNVKDVLVADFNGDLTDNLLLLGEGSSIDGLEFSSNNQEAAINIHDTDAKKGIAFKFQAAGVATLNIHNAKWITGNIYLGSGGLKPAIYKWDAVPGRVTKWKYIQVTLNHLDDQTHGIMPSEDRPANGIFVSYLPATDEWFVEVSGNSGQSLVAKLTSSTDEIVNFQPFAFNNGDSRVRPRLLIKIGDKWFDKSIDWGLTQSYSCPSGVAADFDNDMDIDIYLACTDALGNKDNIYLDNVNGSFVAAPKRSGAFTRNVGTGGLVSAADFNNDGFMDIMVTDGKASVGYPFHFGRRFLLKNNGNGNNWLQIDLEGCQSNRDGIGAIVYVDAGGILQMRTANGGVHHGTQNQKRLHFGLGKLEQASVKVHWPSGMVTETGSVQANNIISIKENELCLR